MSEIKYGFVNDIPIDPGYGKEIVPLNDSIAFGVEVYDAQWVESGQLKPWRPWTGNEGKVSDLIKEMAYRSYVLAFRRPKAVQAGQEDVKLLISFPSKNEIVGVILPTLSPSLTADWLLQQEAELTRLRTLTAAQSVALEKAEEALLTAKNTVECASIDTKTGEELPWYKQANQTLTLISAVKEVGK